VRSSQEKEIRNKTIERAFGYSYAVFYPLQRTRLPHEAGLGVAAS